MINIDDNGLFDVFPAIKTISETFEYQNAMLNKIVLTGKINALEIAENLFNFTEQTAQTFTELQSQIVLNLLRENQNELFLKAQTKSQIVIDTIMKNIYSRKADIEILAKDNIINDFLENKVLKEDVKNHLQDFIEKYTIYNEIMILDNKGFVKANLNSDNKVRISKDNILREVKKRNGILIDFRKTDLFINQRTSLFYVTKIGDKGILVAFLNFKEESSKIFSDLITESETLTISDKRGNILASSEKGLDKSFLKGVKKIDEFVVANNMFHVKTKSEFDEGLNWFGVSSYRRRKDINIIAEFTKDNMESKNLVQINLNNVELQKLADDGYAILEDLSDVIINGELIAAKSKQYILIPILDNLREVSFKIVKLIELSIRNLQQIIDESITNDVTIISKFVTDSITRNLYERSNDVKWWATLLKDDFENGSNLSNTLKYFNNLYKNYSDIFVYDTNGKIIYISNSENLKGENIPHNYTNSNRDRNHCFVSDFVENKFSKQKTYTYYGTILNNDNKVIGGIGVVFDAKKEFNNIFDRVFRNKNGTGLIVDKYKNILFSTNNEKFSGVFDLLNNLEDNYIGEVKIDKRICKIAVSRTSGYREYKNDNLYSIILLEQ